MNNRKAKRKSKNRKEKISKTLLSDIKAMASISNEIVNKGIAPGEWPFTCITRAAVFSIIADNEGISAGDVIIGSVDFDCEKNGHLAGFGISGGTELIPDYKTRRWQSPPWQSIPTTARDTGHDFHVFLGQWIGSDFIVIDPSAPYFPDGVKKSGVQWLTPEPSAPFADDWKKLHTTGYTYQKRPDLEKRFIHKYDLIKSNWIKHLKDRGVPV